MTQKILITGAAGFVGGYLCRRILETTDAQIVALDNLNDYYDVGIKVSRLELLRTSSKPGCFTFIRGDICDAQLLNSLFSKYQFDIVVNLAAQAGVRYSIENPQTYIDTNLVGFFNILEGCRHHKVQHLVFASSSSVYGENTALPYTETDQVNRPVSLYAATKASNELMAHAYSKLYDIPCTGLRFFTVYGPLGRPDMAYFKFANQMARHLPIQIYNQGHMQRDFTYIDDIITGLTLVMRKAPPACESGAKYKVYNIGNSDPVPLLDFINELETALLDEKVISVRPERVFLPMQAGDVSQTFADTTELQRDFNYKPSTTLRDGLHKFARWYSEYNVTKG